MEVLRYAQVFTRVVELQNFSEAGRQLGLVKSSVSKQVSMLEKKLGTQLITRSTRKLSLTQAGKSYYQYCKEIINLELVAENELRSYQDQPRGLVRIASDLTFGRLYLAPLISELNIQYPELKIELLLEDKIVNIIEENIDLSVRVGWLQNSNLIARKLFDSKFVVFTSPEYIKRQGMPSTPKTLIRHHWLALNLLPSPLTWHFKHRNGSQETIVLTSKLVTNSVEALVALVKNGSGISVLAEHSISAEIAKGELIPLFEQYELQKVGVYAVYPKTNIMPVKTQVVLDKLMGKYHSQNPVPTIPTALKGVWVK